jgi:hypothetical protein
MTVSPAIPLRAPSSRSPRARAASTILLAGIVAGALDLSDAFLWFGFQGVSPIRICQHIASGLLGRASFAGGNATALLGAALHFAMTCIMATIYYAASVRLPPLNRHAAAFGVLYGLAIFVVMNQVVVPLSAATAGTFTWPGLANGLLIHMLGVGLPIALIVRRRSIGAGLALSPAAPSAAARGAGGAPS